MAVPKKRKSRARRDMRRSQHMKLDVPDLSTCPQCRKQKMPHRVCMHCGFYKGVEIIDVLARQRKNQQQAHS